MDSSLISVIVPVFNTEEFLAPCLDSILSQSYKNLEVIVVNDGSTDFSLNIAENYAEKDDRVKVYSYPNAGLSEARNRGLAVATGQFFCFVDSDDLLLPNALEILISVLYKENADIAEGIFIKGKILPTGFAKKKLSIEIFNPQKAIENVLYQKKLTPSTCGKIYRASLFENLYYEKGILYEDLNIFYLILEKANKLVWVDFPVYFYRQTEGSILNSWKPQRLDVLRVTENMENYIREKYPSLLPAAKDRRLSANFNMFALCSINGDKDNAHKCWQHIKQNRRLSLLNKNVRRKNKAGILLSYFGKNIFNAFARRIYNNP